MNKIFIDLEMNKVEKVWREIRQSCTMEIIQIGAVKLDEENREVSSFNRYVKPMYSTRMDPKIEKLTHITYDQLANADAFETVFAQFLQWCGDDYEIYSWSLNDIDQLQKELTVKHLPFSEKVQYAFDTWHDYQAEFGALFPLERSLSLKDAVSLAGLDFEGAAHDGLNDARNTAYIFRMTKDPMVFREFKQNVLDLFKPKSFTMGDLFNFGAITFA